MTKDGKPLTHSTKWDDISPQGQHYLLELECALIGGTLHSHRYLPVAQLHLQKFAIKVYNPVGRSCLQAVHQESSCA